MTVGETTGGLPYVLRETITTTGRKINLKINPKWICIRVSGNPCKVYFSQEDYDNDENFIGIHIPSSTSPYGEWRSVIDTNYIWLRGFSGSSEIELVCTTGTYYTETIEYEGAGGFSGDEDSFTFQVTASGPVALGLRGIAGTQLIVDPGDGTAFDVVNFVGIGAGTPWTHDYTATPGTWNVRFFGITNIYYFYANGVPIANVNAFFGMVNCQVFHINSSPITGDIDNAFSANNWPAMAKPILAGTCDLNVRDLSLTFTTSAFKELTSLQFLVFYGNTVTGDINEFAVLTNIKTLYGFGLDLSYTTESWAELSNFDIRFYSCGLTSTEVDNFLIDLAASGSHDGFIFIAGTNAARTSASDGAMAILLLNNVIVDVNE